MVDFIFSEKRAEPAARAFFVKAIGSNGTPEKVAMDISGANKAGMNTIKIHLALLFLLGGPFLQIEIRQVKYLNNIVEQDHLFIRDWKEALNRFMIEFEERLIHAEPNL